LVFFIEYLKNQTTESQLKEILLQRDHESDTMLQYAETYLYQDNFVYLAMLYNETLPIEDVQKTFTDRKKGKLPSFAGIVQSASTDVINAIEYFLKYIFENDRESYVEYLSRRNENGDTVFSIYKNQKRFWEKLTPFMKILTDEEKEKVFKKI
jgi:hypothetical protein